MHISYEDAKHANNEQKMGTLGLILKHQAYTNIWICKKTQKTIGNTPPDS